MEIAKNTFIKEDVKIESVEPDQELESPWDVLDF